MSGVWLPKTAPRPGIGSLTALEEARTTTTEPLPAG